MSQLLIVLAAVVAVAAAVRSTWSPCGLSMLSTITPLAERGRGRRFASTAAWFVVGAVIGGLTLGAGAAVLAWAVHATGLSVTAAVAIGGVAALITAASDLRTFGVALPNHPRQVNERWLDQYRSWIYGVGFGWQIGVGLSTYIMTAAVYLVIVLSGLTASPFTALAIGGLFGLVRGLAILLASGITSPGRLRSFHRQFAAWAEPVRRAVIGVQLAVAVAALAAAGGALVAAFALVAVAALVAVSLIRPPKLGTKTDAIRPARMPGFDQVRAVRAIWAPGRERRRRPMAAARSAMSGRRTDSTAAASSAGVSALGSSTTPTPAASIDAAAAN